MQPTFLNRSISKLLWFQVHLVSFQKNALCVEWNVLLYSICLESALPKSSFIHAFQSSTGNWEACFIAEFTRLISNEVKSICWNVFEANLQSCNWKEHFTGLTPALWFKVVQYVKVESCLHGSTYLSLIGIFHEYQTLSNRANCYTLLDFFQFDTLFSNNLCCFNGLH